MTLFRTLDTARQALTRPVVTIGNFDAVHIGHQELVRLARARAGTGHAVALTFDPHPVRFFRPDAPPFELVSTDERVRLLTEGYGLDGVVMLPFNATLSGLAPEAFVREVLVAGLDAAHVIVGEDFRFGARRAGDPALLRALGAEHGVGVTICPPVCLGGEEASSTRVREALRRGDTTEATALLGRPFELSGVVVHGDARGRTLGFPTANIAATNPMLPRDGIYASVLHDPERGAMPAATYIGARPTYYGDSGLRVVESFVLRAPGDDTPLDLYHHDIRLALHAFLRPDQSFDSSEALIAQIERDVAQARVHLASAL